MNVGWNPERIIWIHTPEDNRLPDVLFRDLGVLTPPPPPHFPLSPKMKIRKKKGMKRRS